MNVPATVQGVLAHGHHEGGMMISCGAASIKGRRPQQEDMLMVHASTEAGPLASSGEVFASQGAHSGFSLVGVFDGHGGKRCSRYAAQNLPENFHAALNEVKGGALGDPESVGPALRLAYRLTHEDFARMARGEGEARPKTRQRVQHALEKSRSFSGDLSMHNGNGAPMHRSFPAHGEDNSFAAVRNRMLQQRMALGSRVWDDGSTALTCLLFGQRAFVANAGDSRAVGCVAGRVVPLSVDHKPNLPAERNRIQNAGGTVTSMMGCHRVMGMLAMSRALGDVMIEQYLSQVPDVVEQPLAPRDFLIMASDGLWDVVSNQEALARSAAQTFHSLPSTLVCHGRGVRGGRGGGEEEECDVWGLQAVQIVSAEANKANWNPEQLSNIANKVALPPLALRPLPCSSLAELPGCQLLCERQWEDGVEGAKLQARSRCRGGSQRLVRRKRERREAQTVTWAVGEQLCMEAFRRGSMDNISVVLILANSGGQGSQPPSQPRGLSETMADAQRTTDLPSVARGMHGRALPRSGVVNGKGSGLGMGMEGPRRKEKLMKEEMPAPNNRGGLGVEPKSRLEPLGVTLRGSQTLGGKRGMGGAGGDGSWKSNSTPNAMPRAGRGMAMVPPGKRAEHLLSGTSRRGASY